MDTAEDRAQYRDLFREYSAFAAEFPRLVATRNRILGAVAKLPAGIPVAQLRKAVSHSGKTKFGVMINQLVRGGWLVRSGDGEAARLTWGGALVDDMTFLKSEIGHPQGLFAVAAGGSAERKWWEFWKS
jgi:hypothetical protein